MINIFVGNLLFRTTDVDLKQMFEPYGEVSSAMVIKDKATGRSRGFGFVEMPDRPSGEKAIAEMNGKMIGGRALQVNEARPRDERPPRRDRPPRGDNS